MRHHTKFCYCCDADVSNMNLADAISLINTIHERKMKAGVAISPDTPSSAITDEIATLADMLLVITVYPGRSFTINLFLSKLIFFSSCPSCL